MVLEAWNLFGDIGAGKRSFQRKLAEADALAVAAWGTAAPTELPAAGSSVRPIAIGR